MAATFNPALSTSRDHIRLKVNDRHLNATAGDVTNAILQDETLDALLNAFGWAEALAQAAEACASYFSQLASRYDQTDGIQAEWRQRVDQLNALAKAARAGTIAEPATTRKASARVIARTISLPGYADELCGIEYGPYPRNRRLY